MSVIIRSALVAIVLVSGVSAASARSAHVGYDNATPRSQLNLNTTEGQRAFWEDLERSGR